MENLVTGLGSGVAILVIFISSFVMSTLTQTLAENLYPDLKEKRDMLFWVWLFAWVAILTVLWNYIRAFLGF
jgi:hypothetical protein